MRTIYIYLSWTGWIWFIIVGSYLYWKLRAGKSTAEKRGFEVISTEAKQSNEHGNE